MVAQDPVKAHLIIKGHVQGVFYRANTVDRARALGLSGWVKNRSDGTVEAVAQGARKDVDQLVDWCRSGPPAATVTHVEVRMGGLDTGLEGFQVRH